jgi:hypothetical protein
MRILFTALLIPNTMATLSQTFLHGNKPRIVHGISFSDIFSYPSAGGFIRKSITQAELEWLGLKPRLWSETSNKSIPIAADKMYASDDMDMEDAFALRIMQLGGRWWPDRRLYERHPDNDFPYGHHYPPDLDIGYNSEGVFVLRTRADNSINYQNLPDIAPKKPETWSRLSLCATMEERCIVLRDFGAVVYNSVEECPDLPNSLEEGITQGKQYAELLRKMEDPHYLDQWLCSL